jgi:hypothetical protein
LDKKRMNSTLPSRARFMIVGGGAVACGVAFAHEQQPDQDKQIQCRALRSFERKIKLIA